MINTSPPTDAGLEGLLDNAAGGDDRAARSLLEASRGHLRRLIASRLDRRLSSRLDASDVVQETLADAARRLPEYVRHRPLPFLAWLARLAADRLARTHRDHIASGVRAIGREVPMDGPAASGIDPRRGVARFACGEPTPGRRLVHEERRLLIGAAIDRLSDSDRELLGLRYEERLAFDEIAAVLGIGLSAAKMRHLRALERLRNILEERGMEPSASS